MNISCGAYRTQIDIAGRALLALVFFMGGVSKVMDPVGTAGYMTAFNIPFSGLLVWVAALYLIIASVLLVVGYKKCVVASSLALYTLLVTLIFHNDLSDQMQMILAIKNLGILGGLLMVVTSCGGSCQK